MPPPQPKYLNNLGSLRLAYFLSQCLRLGWTKADLDWLQLLWVEHHDSYGKILPPRLPAAPGE